MSLNSKKQFIEKIKEGYRLEMFREYKRTLYVLCKKECDEITVAISLIRKLEEQGVVDSNWDVHLPT
jgi:ribosomal protein S25